MHGRQGPDAGQVPIILGVENVADEDVPAYGCMAVTGMEVIGGILYREVDKPSTTFALEYLFNGPGVIPHDENRNKAHLHCGLYQKVLCATEPSYGDLYGVKPDQWALEKGYPALAMVTGIQIQAGSTYFADAAIRRITTLLGKTTGAITALTPSTSYKIYAGTMGSETDSGFATVLSAVSRTAIASGKWIELRLGVNNGVEMIPLEC
jgi:hypothetical protein